MSEFDLEGAIAQWRARLSWRDAFTEADLDEMESHLRDEVASLVSSGLSEQKAFYQTIHTFGENMKLAWRFNQANWETVMVKRTRYAPTLIGNYFKVAVRNLLKHKVYSAINVCGLAIGIACSVLILLFVQHELSYDRFHEKADRIYRVGLEWQYNTGEVKKMASTAAVLAPILQEDFPGIERAVRFASIFPQDLSYKNIRFDGDFVIFADTEVFNVFSFPFLQGDPETALSKPLSVVLTEDTARKYFGDEDPMGKVLTANDSLNLTVTGILASLPSNSHIAFDVLIPFHSIQTLTGVNPETNWGFVSFFTYILLSKSVSSDQIAPQIYEITRRYNHRIEDELEIRQKHFLQPLTDIHLHSNFRFDLSPPGSMTPIYIFSSIAVFILLIACINFMNLATARSLRRAQEVGMRKVVGALRKQLIVQFLGESFLFSSLSLSLSLGMIYLTLPYFNELANKNLSLNLFHNVWMSLGLVGITLAVGLFSGLYPAFAVSSFKPIAVLKGSGLSQAKGARLRKGLIVFQFVISVFLLISTGIIYDQLHYMSAQNLGFDKEQVVIIPSGSKAVQKKYDVMKAELLKQPNVLNVSFTSSFPGRTPNDITVRIDGQSRLLLYYDIDYNYIETFGLELVAGRNFSREFPTDETEAFMLNEKALEYLGWGSPEEALGKTAPMISYAQESRLIGVVKDFHHASLQQPIQPLLLIKKPSGYFICVKINTTDVSNTLQNLESVWQQVASNRPFHYSFLDEKFDRQYRNEQRLASIFTTFSSLSIFIACLGLLGLISFATEQRTKEIGVRKVLGASVRNIIVLLTRDFVKLVFWANLIAWPVAYFAMDHWLQDFAYRTKIGMSIFVVSGLAAVLIALLTIGYQAVKAACSNPIDALRYE